MTARKILIASCFAPLFALPARSWAGAQPPTSLNDQGQLFDATGNPATGTHNLTFTIYDGGGTALWSETLNSVPFTGTDGYFSVNLNVASGYIGAADEYGTFETGNAASLGVAVDGDPEMSPRQAIDSVPFALDARSAASVNTASGTTVIDGAGNVELHGSDALYAYPGGTAQKVVDSSGNWVGNPITGTNHQALTKTIPSTTEAINSSGFTYVAPTATFTSSSSNEYALVSVSASCYVNSSQGFDALIGVTKDGLNSTAGYYATTSNGNALGSGVSEWRPVSQTFVVGPLTNASLYSFSTALTNTSGQAAGGTEMLNCTAATSVVLFTL
jgi:hypothetical protein